MSEKPVFDMSNVSYAGFWEMFWVKLRGKKHIRHTVQHRVIYYIYKGKYYFSDIEDHNIFKTDWRFQMSDEPIFPFEDSFNQKRLNIAPWWKIVWVKIFGKKHRYYCAGCLCESYFYKGIHYVTKWETINECR